MNCKKCGKENSVNSLYCSTCGYRLDGKKKCDNCNQMIEENAIYCNFCGSRVDGKNVCKNCGSVYEGAFCTQCGAGKAKKVEKQSVKKDAGKGVFNKVVSIVTPCLVLLALLFLFINSFLIELTWIYKTDDTTNSVNVFYFFGDIYKETSELIKHFEMYYKNDLNLPVVQAGWYTTAVLGTIIFALNIIISLITLIVASVKTGMAIYKNEKVNITKYLALSFTVFIILLIYFISVHTSYITSSYGSNVSISEEFSYKLKLNGFSILTIVVSLAVIIGNWILKTVADFKVKPFIKDIITLISMALIFIMVISLKGTYINITKTVLNSLGTVTGKAYACLTPSRLMDLSLRALLGNVSADVEFMRYGLWAVIAYALFIIIIILVGFSLKNAINNTARDKKACVTALVLSILNFVFIVAYLIVTIMFASNVEYYIVEDFTFVKIGYTQPIILVILAVFTLGLAIANLAIKTEEVAEIEYYCTDF